MKTATGSINEIKRRNIAALCSALLAGTALVLAGCGGGGDGAADSASGSSTTASYISFTGNANGESVVDANNQLVKFRTNTRTMEVPSQASTNITLDGSNRLVENGNKIIGSVQMIGGANSKTIAGLVSPDGTMLSVITTPGGVSLEKTTVVPPAPGGVVTNNPGTSGTVNGPVVSGGLTWTKTTAQRMTWAEANAYCVGMSARLPTLEEIRNLYLSGAVKNAGWVLGDTWSSTTLGSNSTGSYYVYDLSVGGFGIGYYQVSYFENGHYYATCVR